MNTAHWIAAQAQRLHKGIVPPAPAGGAGGAEGADGGHKKTDLRQLLRAGTARKPEALSPRALRRTLDELRAVVDPGISEVEGGRRARALAEWYAKAPAEQRYDMWLLMSEQFMADPQRVQAAQAEYAKALGTPDEAAAEVLLRRATVSPRRRLLQRFSADTHGVRFLVDLRAQMQGALKNDRRLRALDVEMEYMFSTWFDVGFLDLRRISWDSPASLVEKLIRYEAVHDIRSWDDVKNRLDSDRRCYGFFHPRLPDEPLIFIEVALLREMARSITPLLDETAAPSDLRRATTAIFYSISNTQDGLRGVSFGDSLIKRVVESLQEEFPQLKTFATLSPIPGLRAWLQQQAGAAWALLPERLRRELGPGIADLPSLLAAADAQGPEASTPVVRAMLRLGAHYIVQARDAQGRPADAVARFHLGNGARVEALNWQADPSAKGRRQSCTLMVNYLYDLRRLDRHRALLAKGQVAASSAVQGLLS